MQHGPSTGARSLLAAGVAASSLLLAGPAAAHHEALFGPQSSLAVEASGFASAQTHTRAYGVRGTETQETTFILSAGLSPLAGVPWSITLVQPFTYQTSRVPTAPGSTGPFTTCDGCLRRENNLVSTAYRFDLAGLQRATGKDGTFALISAALEPPTGNKDYPAFEGPFNFIGAGMLGFETGAWSAVVLGYYRANTPDRTSSKKGDNFLLGAGVAYTPLDEHGAMLSVQLGLGTEVHLRDRDQGTTIDRSGGTELLVSPTLVGSPVAHLRFFALVSLPVAQSYRADADHDRWRAGFGAIYSFDREEHAPLAQAAVH
ncbi:MAG: hypothetical protein NVSMB47_10100 [Polyangiales bacterium]